MNSWLSILFCCPLRIGLKIALDGPSLCDCQGLLLHFFKNHFGRQDFSDGATSLPAVFFLLLIVDCCSNSAKLFKVKNYHGMNSLLGSTPSVSRFPPR